MEFVYSVVFALTFSIPTLVEVMNFLVSDMYPICTEGLWCFICCKITLIFYL